MSSVLSSEVFEEGRKWGLEIEAQKDFMTVSIEVGLGLLPGMFQALRSFSSVCAWRSEFAGERVEGCQRSIL